MFSIRRSAAAAGMTAALLIGAGAAAAPSGASPVITGGLVNVTVTDVVSHNTTNVQIPIGVAANVCGVAANVLAQRTSTGPVDCTAANLQQLPVAFR